jgi:hypothetical protein
MAANEQGFAVVWEFEIRQPELLLNKITNV